MTMMIMIRHIINVLALENPCHPCHPRDQGVLTSIQYRIEYDNNNGDNNFAVSHQQTEDPNIHMRPATGSKAKTKQ